jgi:LysM repeat protein
VPSVAVRTNASDVVPGFAGRPQHRKIHLMIAGARLTLPLVSPEVQHSEIAAEWVQIPRPGQRPLLRRSADRLRQMQLTVIFADGILTQDGRQLEAEGGLRALERISNEDEPIVVAYGPFEAGLWRLTDVNIRSQRRQIGSNKITQAEASLTFVQAFDDGYRKPVSPTPPPPTGAPVKPPGAPAGHGHYTVKRGDTLSKIAAKFYGDANRYPEIARANGINNPSRIKVGQRLIIP